MFASVQELVNNIRKGVREISSPTSDYLRPDEVGSTPSSPNVPCPTGRRPSGFGSPTSLKSLPKSSQKSSESKPPESDTSTRIDATRCATRQAYYQRLVLDDIHHSLSRHTRYRNIGDDMNETWIFENPSVNLGASNCHTCGEYIMTSNYDFYVDIVPHKCMCKCEH